MASADFDRGRRIGKYEILTRLSVGGMAELFLAYTSGPGGFRKFVAVKQILPDIKKDPQFVKMFLDEARITAQLSHANIGQVFDLGQEDGELYLAMEFISGQNLERLVKVAGKRERAIPVGLVARAMRDTCLGLHYAHHFVDPSGKPSPVIHRDVSPKNVMLTYTGDVKVIDFGIAKAKGRLGRTQVGIVKGTSGYMSPEQVRGEPLDGRSDLFAVGVMLYELATAQRLFTGASEAAMMVKIAEEEVPDPRTVNPALPEPLAEVIVRSLQKDRDARFATGKEMARAIEAAAAGELFEEEQAAAVMKELFEDRMATTRELLEAATHSEDARQLDAAAESLRDEPDPSPRPRQKTPPGRKKPPPPPTEDPPTPPRGKPQGAGRYASKVAADYALYGQADHDTVQDAQPQKRRPTEEVRAASAPARPQGAPKAGGWGGRLFLVVLLAGVGGLGASVKVGPLQPFVGPLADRFTGWVQKEMAGEPPPPPPQPLKRTALPAQAVSLIEKEKAQAEEEKRRAEAALQAQANPPKEPPPVSSKEQAEQAEKAKKKPAPVGKVALTRRSTADTTRTDRPDGEAEVLDTRSRAGAARDGLGWLSLFTVPPAQVYDGATNLGVSPLTKIPMQAGTYRLTLVDPDGKNRLLSAPIKKGEVTTLKIQLGDLPVQPEDR